MRHWLLVMVLGVLAIALPARAEFNLMEDFDGLPLGGIDEVQSTGAQVWDTHVDGTDTQAVVASPTEPAGDQSLLSAAAGSTITGCALDVGDPAVAPHNWIDNDETGTLFLRVYMPAEGRVNNYVGAASIVDELDSVSQANFRAGVIFYNGSTGGSREVHVIDGGQGALIGTVEGDTWYNLWIVANNVTDTFDFYMTSGTESALESDLVAADLSFNGTVPWTSPLKGLILRGSTNSTGMYVDDIYWDGDAKNLENPVARVYAHDPEPANGSTLVSPDTLLSWTRGHDPYDWEIPNPGIYQQEVWFSTAPGSATLEKIATVDGTVTSIDPAVYGKTLVRDATYWWRVDTYAWENDPNFYPGPTDWSFETEPTAPVITASPANVLVGPGEDAEFVVEAYNPITSDSTGLGYQWYKVGDPDDVALSDGAAFSGTTTATLTVLDVQVADEGSFYCEVELLSNSATVVSDSALLTMEQVVAYWPFDGSYVDASGNGNDADPNGVTQFVEGIVSPTANGAARVDYSNGWATAGTFDPSGVSDQLTITGWVRPDAIGPQQTILSKRETFSDMRWQLRIDSGGEIDFFNDGSIVSSDSVVAAGEWTFVAAVYDGTGDSNTAWIYINGEQDGRNGWSPNPGVAATMRIGHADANIGQALVGALDDIKVYNYALDELEIAEAYYNVTGESPCVYPIDEMFDTNGDCKVDLVDFATWTGQWLTCGRYPSCATP